MSVFKSAPPQNSDTPASFSFLDFLHILAHTYHREGYPPPSLWTIWNAVWLTGFIVWGINWLCS